jgi:hypothetical protein
MMLGFRREVGEICPILGYYSYLECVGNTVVYASANVIGSRTSFVIASVRFNIH